MNRRLTARFGPRYSSAMPKFSDLSARKLATCDDRLQRVFNAVIKTWDCTVLVGHRDQEEQDEAFRAGLSGKQWPDGMHNSYPSKAADVAPYPIDWKDTEAFILFAGFVLGTAAAMGIALRWGGDWNRDGRTKDDIARKALRDLVHFEVVD